MLAQPKACKLCAREHRTARTPGGKSPARSHARRRCCAIGSKWPAHMDAWRQAGAPTHAARGHPAGRLPPALCTPLCVLMNCCSEALPLARPYACRSSRIAFSMLASYASSAGVIAIIDALGVIFASSSKRRISSGAW
uniref:Uncharacterized protein n=1 Tax=Chlamydomonas euryale TaxID=1486919 RepID=A0A7R9V3D2_9CHLO